MAPLLLACSNTVYDRNLRPPDGSLPDAYVDAGADVATEAGVDQGTDRGADVGAPDPLTEAQSFVIGGPVVLTETTGAPPGIATRPTRLDFTMRIDPAGRFVVLSERGSAARSAVTSTDAMTFTTTAPLQLNLTVPGTCAASVTFARLTVVSGAGGVSGTAEGRMDLVLGDVIYTLNAAWTFTGPRDQVGPALGADQGGVDPLSGLFLPASEALPDGVTGQLVGGGDTVALDRFIPMDTGVVAGFSKSKVALRYATTYQMAVAPWTDLAANVGGTLPKVTTLAAPPVVAEDGFENATGTPADAAVVDAAVAPPIAGMKSVGIAFGISGLASRRFTVRLAVGAAKTVVRFSLRPFSPFQQTGSNGSMVQIAVPGGAIAIATLPTSSLNTMYTPPGGTRPALWLGDVANLEIPLPAGVGSEVVFDAAAGPPFGCGLPPLPAGFLIDNLRVE